MRELTYFPLLERYPVTSPYGWRTSPTTGAESFHRGVDYGAPSGVPLIAPYDGQVTTGYESGGAGYWIWVANGPDLFKSFHHSHFAVSGGWVEAGTVVAYIDSTGSSTGSHAHLELWENGVNIDPTGYFNRAPVKGEDDEMTEDDWTRLQHIVADTINSTMSTFYTGNWAVGAQGEPGLYELVMKDGVLGRRHIPNPDQIRMLQYADYMSGENGQSREIKDAAQKQQFLQLPVFSATREGDEEEDYDG